MTTTLVLGAVGRANLSYAQWLLRDLTPYTQINAATVGYSLTSALLNSRQPVLLHGLLDWVDLMLGGLPHTEGLHPRLVNRIDEFVVARRHVPFDVVTVGREAGWGVDRTADPGSGNAQYHALAYLNSKLSSSSDLVHVLMAGRVLDLSEAKPIPWLIPES